MPGRYLDLSFVFSEISQGTVPEERYACLPSGLTYLDLSYSYLPYIPTVISDMSTLRCGVIGR